MYHPPRLAARGDLEVLELLRELSVFLLQARELARGVSAQAQHLGSVHPTESFRRARPHGKSREIIYVPGEESFRRMRVAVDSRVSTSLLNIQSRNQFRNRSCSACRD